MRPPHLRRALCAALALASVALAAGCERPQQGETRVTVIGGQPALADPAAGPLTPPQAVLHSNVAQGLVRFDARGQIVPGLAERWTVSDDGLSYIFRLQAGEWPDGRRITAQQVARLLRLQVASRSRNPLKDALGLVDEIVPMTDRVLEIRLDGPLPGLLQLLAQPELGIVRDGQGTGPFELVQPEPPQQGEERQRQPQTLELARTIPSPDEDARREEVSLGAAPAPDAVRAFLERETDLVLGGTFADLPYARTEDMPRGALRFDPASGLFGLVPARADGPLGEVELRRLLSQAIDRQALIDALDVPGLLPRATILEPGLDGLGDPVPPPWTAVPLEQRRPELAAAATGLFEADERPTIRIALPDAPGAQLLFNRLAADWAAIGITLERAGPDAPADLELIDAVAPSTSAAWFLRAFRCGQVALCDPETDALLDASRAAPVLEQRYALLAQAAQRIDEQQMFLPLAAPIRWSLVSDRVPGFATNRYVRHTLTGLGERLNRERAE